MPVFPGGLTLRWPVVAAGGTQGHNATGDTDTANISEP